MMGRKLGLGGRLVLGAGVVVGLAGVLVGCEGMTPQGEAFLANAGSWGYGQIRETLEQQLLCLE